MLADLNHESYDENPARRARKDDPPLPGEHDQGLLVGNPYIRTNRIAPRHCAKIKARSLARPL